MKFNKIYLITWKIFKFSLMAFCIYYIAENIYFFIQYGWHLTAQSSLERECDKIYIALETMSIVSFFVTVYGVIDYYLTKEDKQLK